MAVVQLVRASDCGSECRGFESHLPPPPQKEEILIEFPLFLLYIRDLREVLQKFWVKSKKYVDIIFEKHLKGQSEIECFSQRCHYNICIGLCVRTCRLTRIYVQAYATVCVNRCVHAHLKIGSSH